MRAWYTTGVRYIAIALLVACGSPAESIDAQVAEGQPMWMTLFDGALTPAWRMSTITNQPGRDDPGRFDVIDGTLVATPGTDLGLFWYAQPTPTDFELSLEWKASAVDDNSGVFVRFPDLDSKGYNNTAWVAIDFGFEVQIDNTGLPDGSPLHTTGAIYNQPDQQLSLVPARGLGEWNEYLVRAVGQVYTVTLNGTQTTHFENRDASRGAPSPAYFGMQTHTGRVAFRNIRIRAL